MLEIKNLTVKVKNNAPILTDVSLSIQMQQYFFKLFSNCLIAWQRLLHYN